MAFPGYRASIPEFIHSVARQFSDRELIVLGQRRLSYQQAERQSAQLAKAMLSKGITKGSHVGLLMPNGPDFLLALLAATRIGAVVIPVNTFLKAAELRYVLQHADIEILLSVAALHNNRYVERLEQALPELKSHTEGLLLLENAPYLRHIYIWNNMPDALPSWANDSKSLSDSALLTARVDDDFLAAVEQQVSPADRMLIIYSSGSTGTPKGVIHSQGSVVKHSFNVLSRRALEEDDRIYSPLPFFWVGGLVFTLFAIMHKGAMLVCEEVFEPGRVLEIIETEGITQAHGFPHYGRALADHPDAKTRDLSTLRAGIMYDILPANARPKDPQLRSNSLGMTETCGPHSLDRMDVDLPESLRGSFGHPVDGVELRIVDPDSGQPLPANAEGELCVRGYSLMQGLYKMEREEVFDKDGFYHTGDICHLNEDKVLFFHGRSGDMIKTGGANVTPQEVEAVINLQAEVLQSFVVGVADEARGQLVAAVVMLNAGASLAADDLASRLRDQLASYKLPRHYFFKNRDEIPFADSGKVDRRSLIQQLERELQA